MRRVLIEKHQKSVRVAECSIKRIFALSRITGRGAKVEVETESPANATTVHNRIGWQCFDVSKSLLGNIGQVSGRNFRVCRYKAFSFELELLWDAARIDICAQLTVDHSESIADQFWRERRAFGGNKIKPPILFHQTMKNFLAGMVKPRRYHHSMFLRPDRVRSVAADGLDSFDVASQDIVREHHSISKLIQQETESTPARFGLF